jgi:hypothetical protein
MTQYEIVPATENDASQALLVDRRRPGRRDVSPELVMMLRAPETAAGGFEEMDWSQLEPVDEMASMRGIVTGLMLAVPFWAAFFMWCRWAFR